MKTFKTIQLAAVFTSVMSFALLSTAQAKNYTGAPKTMKTCPNTTLTLQSGTSNLTEESQAKLESIVKMARQHGKIDEAQIAVWSDNPVPKEGEELSKPDRDLADSRAKAIQDYLKNPLQVRSVDTYNMAERANWLARTFDTDDAKLKEALARDSHAPFSKEEFRIIRDNGKPSTAVVLVVAKHRI